MKMCRCEDVQVCSLKTRLSILDCVSELLRDTTQNGKSWLEALCEGVRM